MPPTEIYCSNSAKCAAAEEEPLEISASGPVCWVLISATPYHAARFAAFATCTSVPPILLELTDEDPFKCLEVPKTETPYTRRLLRPGLQRSDMTPGSFALCCFRRWTRSRPTVVCVNGWSLPGSIETTCLVCQQRCAQQSSCPNRRPLTAAIVVEGSRQNAAALIRLCRTRRWAPTCRVCSAGWGPRYTSDIPRI